jgi:hypothetical protein
LGLYLVWKLVSSIASCFRKVLCSRCFGDPYYFQRGRKFIYLSMYISIVSVIKVKIYNYVSRKTANYKFWSSYLLEATLISKKVLPSYVSIYLFLFISIYFNISLSNFIKIYLYAILSINRSCDKRNHFDIDSTTSIHQVKDIKQTNLSKYQPLDLCISHTKF